MICPNCQQTNSLTWSKYLASPLGHHSCEHCHARFRFQHTFKYYTAITALWLVGGLLPSIICLNLGATLVQAFIVFWLLGLAVVIPADKKIDNTWRGTILRKP